MKINYEVLKQTNAVFIADLREATDKIYLDNMNLEMTEHSTCKLIMDTMRKLCHNVYFYQSPVEFQNNIAKHQNDVVLSVWSGENSRNRKALVPSICEANKICYVGADAYVHIISQDKKLAKEFCRKYNIEGARDLLIQSPIDLQRLDELKLPLVIKPNYEGGSIGISNENIVYSYKEAQELCQQLLNIYDGILAEEYIEGYEVCICISGVLGEIDIFEAVQSNFGGQEYITSKIYGYEYKKNPNAVKSKKCSTDLISDELKQNLQTLYWSLGKVEVIRIDGRINKEGKFRLIELSPDCSLSEHASTATSYYYAGYDFEDMIASLLWNSMKNQEHQNAKKK